MQKHELSPVILDVHVYHMVFDMHVCQVVMLLFRRVLSLTFSEEILFSEPRTCMDLALAQWT